MAETTKTEFTVREVKEHFPGFSIHQVKYAITEYGIEPRRRVGIIRLWGEEDLPRIGAALSRIARRQGGPR